MSSVVGRAARDYIAHQTWHSRSGLFGPLGDPRAQLGDATRAASLACSAHLALHWHTRTTVLMNYLKALTASLSSKAKQAKPSNSRLLALDPPPLPSATPSKSTLPSPATCATPPPSGSASSAPRRGRGRQQREERGGKSAPTPACSTPLPRAGGARTRSSSCCPRR